MKQYNFENQIQKYQYIKNQHGGYYRHDFIDHAYLYNLYFPPEAVFNNFKTQIHELVLNYPVAQNTLAELVGKIINQKAERIVVGNGAAELIKIVSSQIANKLIIPVPSFNEYVNAAPSGKTIEFHLEYPSFQLDVDKFATQIIKNRADIAVIVSPNNPTSLLVPKDDLLRLLKKIEGRNCILIVDESFIDFSQNPEEATLENDIEKYNHLVIVKSMSKAYGICGIRIGYMLTANTDFAEAVRKGVHIWNINGFAEEFLRILPDYRQEFLDSCNLVRIDRDQLYKDLSAIPDMIVYKPDANYIFCRLPSYSRNAMGITEKLFIDHNIYIKHLQGKTLKDSDRYIRIASRTKSENSTLVDALANIIKLGNKVLHG